MDNNHEEDNHVIVAVHSILQYLPLFIYNFDLQRLSMQKIPPHNQLPIKNSQHLNKQQNLLHSTPYRKSIDIKGQTNYQSKILEQSRIEIIKLKQGKLYEQALKRLNKLLDQYPNDLRSYQIKGQILFARNMYSQSLICYEKLIDLTGAVENLQEKDHIVKQREANILKSLYYYNKGICLQKLGRFTQAVVSLKWSITLNKNKIETYVSLADCYRQQGSIENMTKIYEKIIDKNESHFEYLMKCLCVYKQLKDYEMIIKFADKGLKKIEGVDYLPSQHLIHIYFDISVSKADALKKLSRFPEAIKIYQEMLKYVKQQRQQEKLIYLYSKLAICYDDCGNLPNSSEYYNKILSIDSDNLETINNLANVELRRGNFTKSIQILDSGIIKCLMNRDKQDEFKLILMKSHRIIAFTKLNRLEEAGRDLNEISTILKETSLVEMDSNSEWNYFNFIKYILNKYSQDLNKIQAIRSRKSTVEVQNLQRQLYASISQQLQLKKPTQQDELSKLSERINNLYKEIVEFKQTAMKEHENSQIKVHSKIEFIQKIIEKKHKETNQLEEDMQQLKAQYSDIYKMIQEQTKIQQNSREFPRLIYQLKQDNKSNVASYAQQLYWIFNAYMVSIRLIANQLVQPAQNRIHLNKVSNFFAKFKKVFQTLSHVPHLGVACDSINILLSFYLNQQSSAIYQTLNKIIVTNFILQEDIQKSLQKAIICLVESGYIDHLLRSNRNQQILSSMNNSSRAYEWFKKQKNRLIGKMLRVDIEEESHEQRTIKELVVQDISAILVYLVKNKKSFLVNRESQNLLNEAFNSTLVTGFKREEIMSLYSRQNNKQGSSRPEGCTAKCQIYTIALHRTIVPFSISKNQVYDQLIGDSIKSNNLVLFNHALSQLDFKFDL